MNKTNNEPVQTLLLPSDKKIVGLGIDKPVDNLRIFNKKYKIIYADPPWPFKTYSKKGQSRTPSAHYAGEMSLAEIKAIPVSTIADKDSVLFLWVTGPNLFQAFEVIKSWGFEYKTPAFVWDKRNKRGPGFFFGMGFYTRANTEFCLLATKGKPLKQISKNVLQRCDARVREHSRKPDEIRNRIVKLFGDLPRVELFARNRVNGWDCYGDQLSKTIQNIL